MPETGIRQEVYQRIINTFSQNLREHLLSDKHYPHEVVIRTEYGDCTQVLKIRFDDGHREAHDDH